MASIDIALKFTLVNEGGYSNVPQDHGGPTNFGITQADYTKFLGRHASAEDVKNMPLSDATAIYKADYWGELDQCHSQAIATCIFDMGVLCGTHTSIKWAQSVCGVPVDGKMGAMTIGMLNQISPTSFVANFANKAQAYFDHIVLANGSQRVFLKGWTNRVNRLRKLNDGPVVSAQPPPSTAPASNYHDKVLRLAQTQGSHVLTLATHLLSLMGSNEPRYVTIFDVTKDANAQRLHLIDTVSGTLTNVTCAVGKGSDPDGDGKATAFSDTSGSGQTSLGVFRYAEMSHMSDGRPCVRLDGLEASNAHMRSRAILLHCAPYVSDSHAGRSLGCEAIAPNHLDFLSKLANGSYGVIG